MSLTIAQTKTAMGPGGTASFLAAGGTAPYSYSVLPDGAGGSINSSTGIYTAPSTVSTVPAQQYDTIQVTDSASNTTTAKILIGTALDLLWDIIGNQVTLDANHLYFYNQKGFEPSDDDMFVVLKIVNVKPYSNRRYPGGVDGGGDVAIQTANFTALIDINVISRSMAAIYQKEQVLMALGSQYAQTQAEANSFKLGKIPTSFVDLSELDGAAILNRFVVSINLFYTVSLNQNVDYFDSVQTPQLTVQA